MIISNIKSRYCILGIEKMIWKEKDLLSKSSSGIRMPLTEWKNILIEHNITRDVNSATRWFKALESFVKGTITKEHTSNGPERKLSSILGPKIWPTCTTKNS
jgi:hypothetical protein